MTEHTGLVRFLGIDAVTTSLKAALFDLDGHMLGIDRQEYELIMPAASVVELDPEVYWEACCRVVRNVMQQTGTSPEQVAALSISSQGETLIPVGKEGLPTRNAIVWLDNRATEEAAEISRHFTTEDLYRVTGQPQVTPTWPACKVFWIRRNEPDVFSRTSRFLLLEDYLLYRLTGRFVTERALQTSSLFLDIQGRQWWLPMLDFIGVTTDQFGELMDPGEIVARLSQEGAETLGLSMGTVAVTGAMDQAVGAVGAGNVVPGMVTETTGGVLGIVFTLDQPRFDPQRRVPCHCHARPESYCLLPWGQTAGMALRWLRDRFFDLEAHVAHRAGLDPYDVMTRMAAQVSPGSEGLVVLPHLEGAACPEFNPAARAVFFGATLKHTKAHFVRAIMESVAYMLKKNLDIIEELGVTVSEIRSMGGGARSDLWLGMKADVLQKPVTPVAVEETACLGAALMAAVATGFYPGFDEAVAHMVRLGKTTEPRQEHHGVYRNGYAQYLELYDRLAPMFG